MGLKYIDISTLSPSSTESINNVIALDAMGNVIVSPLQSDVKNINNEIAEVKKTIPTNTSELTNDSNFITNSYVDDEIGKLNDLLSSNIDEKQNTLVSGENIKTVNNQSLLGEGNIEINVGESIVIDDVLSATSENAVQNKIITNKINDIESVIGNINNVLTQING